MSNDLGAVAGLLFDIGTGRYALPPRPDDAEALAEWREELARVLADTAADARKRKADRDGDRTHTEIQGWLRDLGRALGFDVWVAINDRSRTCGDGRLSDGCLESLPETLDQAPGADAVRLIDVIWIQRGDGRVAAAFEVEHTTSIHSGIVRLLDLALGGSGEAARGLFLVAPDKREEDVRAQLTRPAFSRVGDLQVRFLPYSALEEHRHDMARFGQGMKAIEAVARSLH